MNCKYAQCEKLTSSTELDDCVGPTVALEGKPTSSQCLQDVPRWRSGLVLGTYIL